MRWWLLAALLAGCGDAGSDAEPCTDCSPATSPTTGDTALETSGLTTGDTAPDTSGLPTGDTATPATFASVDVVVVVDNSNSMEAYQDRLAASLPTLLDGLDGADPRFAVVTTSFDPTAPPVAFLGPEEVDTLRALMRPGTGGADIEQPVRSAEQVLASGDVRADAWVSVLVVTDEEECSHYGVLADTSEGSECYTRMDELPTPSELLDRLTTALGRSDIDLHAIAATDASTCDAWASARIADLVSLADGSLHDICAPSFDDAVQNVADTLLQRVEPTR